MYQQAFEVTFTGVEMFVRLVTSISQTHRNHDEHKNYSQIGLFGVARE